MRAVLGMAMMAVGAGASGCGNCDYVVREYNGDVAYDRVGCNTGGSSDKVPYPAWSDMTNAAANASLTFNGTSTAQVATIAEVRTAVGANAWAVSFCGSYLDRYTDGAGSLRGEGATCMRSFSASTPSITVAAFKAADEEAKTLFNMFGTSNGYASSFAITNGGLGDQALKWGTGRTGDVPANWCGVYMKEMLCQIAFPQIAMQKDELATKVAAGRSSGAPYTAQSVVDANGQETHYIRVVEDGSCETLFDVCNRREPETDETKEGYKVPILQNTRASAFKISKTRKLESDAFCAMWKEGFGLGQAGTALGDSGEQVAFESGFMVQVSPFLLVAALFVVMF